MNQLLRNLKNNMITTIICLIWGLGILAPIIISIESFEKSSKVSSWIIWSLCSLLWIVPIFTGIPVKNNVGQYKGYVTAVERNGAIFKGWNVYLKTELESSQEDMACIDRDNQELINKLKEVQEQKENVTLEYEGMWQYPIGECPRTNWQIINIKN